ncbi:MAG: aminotransferase class III-fold pyridoxal phosphate-dependent enzyme [Steroidobacteraceae bacterium]
MTARASARPPDAFWMPFTPNRAFRHSPRLFVRAQGMHYFTPEGRQILDTLAGLWCVNAGHAHPRIVRAIQMQAAELDFVSSFNMSHPLAFEAAARLVSLAPAGLSRVFFSNSGSEAVDTALKMARAYHRARGEGGRIRFIGRAKGYHGVGWGGLSVGGLARHKREFTPLLGDVDHLSLPYDPRASAFTAGQPEQGSHFADELDTLLATIHDPATVAAVIVEPVIGSGGVYPPPKGYLERLREICDRHGILLIFDEVITGFGRLGAPFAARALNITPDIMCCAKGLTNGSVPMGATIARDDIFQAIADRSAGQIEFFHGYTYSAHPLACAAALAAMDVYEQEDLFGRVRKLAPAWAQSAHSLKGARHVCDVRSIGLLAGIELQHREGAAGARGAEASQRCFEAGMLVRNSGDTLLLSPPLIIDEEQIAQVFGTIGTVLAAVP